MANFFDGEDWIYRKLELDKFMYKLAAFILFLGFFSWGLIKEYRVWILPIYGIMYLLENGINIYIWKNRFKISYSIYFIFRNQIGFFLSMIFLGMFMFGAYKYYLNWGFILFALSVFLFFTVFFLGLRRMDLIEESQLLKTKKLDYKEGTVDIVKHAHTDHEWGEVMWIPKFLKRGPSKSLGVAIMGIAGYIGVKTKFSSFESEAWSFLWLGFLGYILTVLAYAYMLSIGVWLLRKEKQIGKKFRIKGINYEK